MEHRLIKALRKQAEADKEEALLTLELLTESPAGIGEHTPIVTGKHSYKYN